jgi:hypothetical protein
VGVIDAQAGVEGDSTTGNGVVGVSKQGLGVLGVSETRDGGRFISRNPNSPAVSGHSFDARDQPFVVDAAARPPWPIQSWYSEGAQCDSPLAVLGQAPAGPPPITEQGTFRFPFRPVGRAYRRAQGTTIHGERDSRRAGVGWTMMIRPVHYPERITIDQPLRLIKDDRVPGPAVIG